MSLDFKGRVAIVTGVSSGMGEATAKLLLANNAKVFGVDVHPLADNTLKAASSSTFVFHQTDLTKAEAAETVVQKALEAHGGRIDILANVAGIMDHFADVVKFRDEELHRVLDNKLKAPLRLMRAVLPHMLPKEGDAAGTRGGAIVNVASKAGTSGASSGIAYTASKHGLVSSFRKGSKDCGRESFGNETTD